MSQWEDFTPVFLLLYFVPRTFWNLSHGLCAELSNPTFLSVWPLQVVCPIWIQNSHLKAPTWTWETSYWHCIAASLLMGDGKFQNVWVSGPWDTQGRPEMSRSLISRPRAGSFRVWRESLSELLEPQASWESAGRTPQQPLVPLSAAPWLLRRRPCRLTFAEGCEASACNRLGLLVLGFFLARLPHNTFCPAGSPAVAPLRPDHTGPQEWLPCGGQVGGEGAGRQVRERTGPAVHRDGPRWWERGLLSPGPEQPAGASHGICVLFPPVTLGGMCG